MVTYLFGVPGSGKSFRAIKFALEALDNNKSVFTNIEILENIDGYTFLDFSLMQKFITDLFTCLEEKDREIEYYVSKLEKVVSKNSLYILDEAHFYGLNDRKKSELWRLFLSIHRHLHIDILIITQTYKNINSSLLDLGEVFIKALPASKRLLQSYLEYIHFATIEAYRTGDKLNILKREKFKADPKIFNIYSSGANNKGSNLLRRKIFLILLGLFIVILFMFYNVYKLSIVSKKSLEPTKNTDTNFKDVENVKDVENNITTKKNSLTFCFYNNLDTKSYNYIKGKIRIYYAEFSNKDVKVLLNCSDLQKFNNVLSSYKINLLKFKSKRKDYNASKLFKRIQLQ